jgi:hypothetical protein
MVYATESDHGPPSPTVCGGAILRGPVATKGLMVAAHADRLTWRDKVVLKELRDISHKTGIKQQEQIAE